MNSLMLTIRESLTRAIAGIDLSVSEAIALLEAKDPETIAEIRKTANCLRQQQVGETVTYVINRNINFTNICEQHCSFCAFRRDAGKQGSFWLTTEQILEKTSGAVDQGATEICMQGGLNPEAKRQGSSLVYYQQLVRTIKHHFPELHLHAFSPQEVQFIAREDNRSYTDVISALRDAGVNSMPGTAAEVLDDKVRKIICPEKINSDTWCDIVSTALRLGVTTTSTMLCGHIEAPQQQVHHLARLRSLQQQALEHGYPAKISEFILLPFVGQFAPQAMRRRVARDQPNLAETLRLTALSRIFLGNWIVNHQPSWVKLGLSGAVEALNWGCNDIGGTLMEEHITTMAGAQGGTYMSVATLQNAIETLNRPYCQRSTIYELLGEQ